MPSGRDNKPSVEKPLSPPGPSCLSYFKPRLLTRMLPASVSHHFRRTCRGGSEHPSLPFSYKARYIVAPAPPPTAYYFCPGGPIAPSPVPGGRRRFCSCLHPFAIVALNANARIRKLGALPTLSFGLRNAIKVQIPRLIPNLFRRRSSMENLLLFPFVLPTV